MTIEQHPSANSSPRYGFKPSSVIIHWSAGFHLADVESAFKARNTSAHYAVDSDTVWQFVDEKRAAWQAGVWLVNLKSIGIEHIGIYEQPVKDETYVTSGQLIADICHRWGFEPTDQTLIPHRNIKATSCPGTLDVGRLIGEARKAYYPPSQPIITPPPTLEAVMPPLPPVPTLPHLSPPAFPKQVKVETNVDGVNLRATASATSAKVGSLANGTIVTASSETNGFYVVGHNQYAIALAFKDA